MQISRFLPVSRVLLFVISSEMFTSLVRMNNRIYHNKNRRLIYKPNNNIIWRANPSLRLRNHGDGLFNADSLDRNQNEDGNISRAIYHITSLSSFGLIRLFYFILHCFLGLCRSDNHKEAV